MAKVSPIIRSFNGGERSPLTEGRTDLEGYLSSSRQMLNAVASPQGPSISRSGTKFVNRVYNEGLTSRLIPFVFSEIDFYMLEFSHYRLRFFKDSGILTYAPVSMTVATTAPFTFLAVGLNAQVGDEVSLSGFPADYNLNGVLATVISKTVDLYTIDLTYPASKPLVNATASRVYHINSPYSYLQINRIEDTASLDTVYFTHPDVKPYKLKRFDTYNWVFEAVNFIDGPYLPINEESTTLVRGGTGKITPNMTSNSQGGFVAFGTTPAAGSDFFHAFDAPDSDSFWQSSTDQKGIIGIQLPAAQSVDGYTIFAAVNNADLSYTSKDYAPSSWTLEASNDGTNYAIIDSKDNYVLYDNNKSLFFELDRPQTWSWFRLNIKSVTRNGPVKPCVRSFMLRSTQSAQNITVNADSTVGINGGRGFLSTDGGRLIRIKDADGSWRSMKITSVTNATAVVAILLGEPFSTLRATSEWRLGAWSDTTGYPNTSVFFQDRTWWGGSKSYPDFLAFSEVGGWERMAPSSSNGEVLDDNGWAGRLNGSRLSLIKWLAAGKDGLLIGTGSQEFTIKSSGVGSAGKTITPANIQADSSSSRGSADVSPVPVDLQVLYVQRGGRAIREFAYSYESDGYKAPSMSLLSSHLGAKPFVQLAYAAEPFSIVWVRRDDGSVVGLTYNREENVIGWHRHDFTQDDVHGAVESIAVIPSVDGLQDILWLVVRRWVNGTEHRYIEKLTPFWDFNTSVQDAWFVDSGLKYLGTPINKVYGIQHLEGRQVYGLADGRPVGPLTVTNGSVQFAQGFSASSIVLGLGFDTLGETSSIEAGAQDGTAQGKEKRINLFTLKVWDSCGGEIGTYNEDENITSWVSLSELYPSVDNTEVGVVNLFTGILGPFTPHPGYEKRGSVFYKRPKESTLPFNIVSIMPQLNVQDRG
jgi:hypothetical protein